MAEEKRPMTAHEAGKRGGGKTKEKYGIDHYAKIGKKGGTKNSLTHDNEFFKQIGKKGGKSKSSNKKRGSKDITMQEVGRLGGKTTSAKYGHEFYTRLGKLGGISTAKKYGHDFYVKIGDKGTQRLKELIEKGKQMEANEKEGN